MLFPQNPYHFLTSFCLRSSVFPLNFYRELTKKDRIEIHDLKNIWENKVVKEALFLASPEFYNQLDSYFRNPTNDINKIERFNQTFLKYLIRVSTRCTPFGLFAGVTTGSFDKQTDIQLNEVDTYKRSTKFDSNYLASLLNYISNIGSIRKQLLFYPNTTLYKIANQYRYIEYLIKNTERNYSIEGIEYTSYLEKIISISKQGKTIKELATSLVDETISFDDARDFINVLIDNQILVNQLEQNITGEDTLETTIFILNQLTNTEKIIIQLKLLQNLLKEVDISIGNKHHKYLKIVEVVKKIDAPFDFKYLFQTDLHIKTKKNQLAIKHGYTIKKTLPFLNKLTSFKKNKNLEQFKSAFIERYEDREIPLGQALDIESGIGYIQHSAISDVTPFLQDITPKRERKNNGEAITFSEVDKIIYAKLLENKGMVLELVDTDFKSIESDWNYLPDTLAAFVEVVNINKQEQLVLSGLSAGAGNLLARFSTTNDALLKQVKNIAEIEQQMYKDKLLAEIIHLPEARTGNILKRPHLRNYEIPYLAKSTIPKSQQILVDDLLVSVKNNRIILKSKRLQKEVLPRLTNAHNYALKGLPIYHFLCDLQYQEKKKYLGFSWSKLAKKHDFLPRVVYRNIILSKARWCLSKYIIALFLKQHNNQKNLLRLINDWRLNYKVPKYVQLVEGDNKLLINLEHFDSLKLLLNTIKRKESSILEEFLFLEDTVVKRGDKQFTNECVITFYNQQKQNAID